MTDNEFWDRWSFAKMVAINIGKAHYCPHCGAKMDGERKEQK